MITQTTKLDEEWGKVYQWSWVVSLQVIQTGDLNYLGTWDWGNRMRRSTEDGAGMQVTIYTQYNIEERKRKDGEESDV